MRTHISLPKDLVDEIDRLAGPRGRSKFMEEAVRTRLQREKLSRALVEAAMGPILDPEAHPQWLTPR
jgi:metal-responsive CopG/Arc/MetJ family transcriptional regulator